MTHIVAGYPSMKECEHIALTMADSGVSFIEIQIPFSDPVADGPTIMAANQAALDNGTSVEECFALMNRIKKNTDIPVLFMTYFNIPFRYGLERFIKKAKSVGCYGLIIPDIPLDEENYDHYLRLCKKHGLHAIQVISPITPERRLKLIAKVATGFVYCVARTGTTGARNNISNELKKYLSRVKIHIKVPIAVGFGISNRQQVDLILKDANIAVIGSKIIDLYKNTRANKLRSLKNFIKKLV